MILRKILFLGLWLLPFCAVAVANTALDAMLINNYNLRQNNLLWDRMRAGFMLDHPQNKLVRYYEHLYTRNKHSFARMIENAKPYIYYLLTETERNGLPSELALLPGVESTFDANARSHSGAYGMWQFVPSTAERFNLTDDGDIDERQDIVRSTKSALNYLAYLYKIFGSWSVAIAAYNWGEGNMYHEVLATGQKPGNIDYDELSLREETKNYLPKLIALASIIEHPEKFGVNLTDLDNKPYFAIVKSGQAVRVEKLISEAKVDKNTFRKLNPQYKDYDYTLNSQDTVLLPLDNQNTYYANTGFAPSTAIISPPLVAATSKMQQPVPVVSDTDEAASSMDEDNQDELAQFANDNSTDADQQDSQVASTIADDNSTDNLPSDAMPQDVNSSNTQSVTDNSSAVDPIDVNDTTPPAVVSVADNHPNTAISPAQPTPKHLDNNEVELNSLIDSIGEKTPPAPTTKKYTVAAGDTLYSIAKRFHANVATIKQQNHIPANNLIAGQTLIIPIN